MAEGDNKESHLWIVVLIIVLVLVGLCLAVKYAKKKSVQGGDEHLLLPAGKPKHVHLVDLDESMSGVSTEDEAHRHAVSEGRDASTIPSPGQPAPHTHDISKYVVAK